MLTTINYERQDEISRYISENENAFVGTESHLILGKIQELPKYEVPVEMLYFNETNGRIFTAKQMMESKLGFILDSKNPAHEKYFIEMLLPNEADTTRLMNNMKELGQHLAGLIMPDGKLINGNRRFATKKKLNQRTMIVSILPSTLTRKELFEIEFGLQVADDFKKEYTGIDRLFMIRKGLEVGKTVNEMKRDFGVSAAEIRDAEITIEKIDMFLEHCGREGQYSAVSNMLEHFKDFVKELNKIEKIDEDTFEVEQVFCNLMELNLDKKENVVAHRDIRDTLYYAAFDERVKEALTRNLDNEDATEEDIVTDLSIAKSLAMARKDNDNILKTTYKLISQIKGVNVKNSTFDFEENGYEKLIQALDQLKYATKTFVAEVQYEANDRLND
ncbi:hypothetical protein [Bacillus sp. MRMR6]|uniref:hypothetical protein n=1 Tax=Bacillus sp. MRMR6 TaxID=1928617 RepID=UPI000952640C|nr:hypothetical protein [Bacillus sp. MRMR6]OLS40833.1 hypothetical protein BTR25_08070 [Bacillus sp. MRMR6]